MPDPEVPKPDPAAELKSALEAAEKARAEATARAEAAEKAAQTAQAQVTSITGQVLSAAAAPKAEPETPPDFSMDPEKALEWHLNRRTAPLVAEQLRRESIRERQLVEMKSPTDWSKYGKEVDELIAKQRISPEVLAQPGSYSELLQFVKSKDVDKIVEERVSAEIAKRTSEAAKTAGAAAGSGVAAPAASPEPEFSADQLRIYGKLGVDPKKAADLSKNTTFDGIRISGEMVH